jgi:uncharacterized repeat protein (TIGR03803 family)
LKICRRAASITLALAVVLAPAISATQSAQAQTYTVLYELGGKHGIFPAAGLIEDEKGNFYSTTENGGTSNGCVDGCGTVFKLDKTGKETVLYSFTGGADGAIPIAGLIRDEAGNLYGTTDGGGASGNGTVFKLDANGKETVLHSFAGGADGADPHAGLIRDAAGNLYSVTVGGGTSNRGTVFKLDTNGQETVLYTFTGGADGGFPEDRLIRDAAGNLYGMTEAGGNSNLGTVFKVDPQNNETVSYSFGGQPDGANPFAGLIRDTQGNLYGTTFQGGTGCGIVFKLDTNGTETVLYSFTGEADGCNPAARLVRDAAGNLYGTTVVGGGVFELDESGTLTVLHQFTGGTDGGTPLGPLLRDAAGDLYGTTSEGGRLLCTGGHRAGCGVVFKLTP